MSDLLGYDHENEEEEEDQEENEDLDHEMSEFAPPKRKRDEPVTERKIASLPVDMQVEVFCAKH